MRHLMFTVASCLLLGGLGAACSPQNHDPASRRESGHAAVQKTPGNGAPRDTGEAARAEAGFLLMQSERLGPLRLGLPAGEVLKVLGKPDEQSERSVWAADGAEHQTWRYAARGIVLGMIAEDEGSRQQIDRITVSDPCRYRTTRGIGIGSSRGEVLEAYRNEIAPGSGDREEGSRDGMVVAGSLYGGVVFTITRDKVAAVFLGAGAE